MNSLPNEVVEHCGIDSRHDLVDKDIFAIQQNGSRCILFWEDLAPYNDINYPYVGMVVRNTLNKESNNSVKILAISGEMIAVSYPDNHDECAYWFSKKNLKRNHTVKPTSPTVTEYSMEEVAVALGKSVEEIKIKE